MAAPFKRTSIPGVYRRGNRCVVTYTDPSGRRRKRSAATIAEARLLKSSVVADIARGEYRESSQTRFADYAREWVRTYEGRTSRGIRPETISEYGRDLELHVIPVIGHRRLSDIEQRELKSLARDLLDKGLSSATVRVVIAPVRALFATALEGGSFARTPPRAFASAAARRVPTRPSSAAPSASRSSPASSRRLLKSGGCLSASSPRPAFASAS